MTFELYPEESVTRVQRMPGVTRPEPGMFTNFFSGAGTYAMQGAAKVARAGSMALSTVAIAEDAYYGTTTAREKAFKFHDDVFKRAVDYWTPSPGEVGAAGEIAGQLLSVIPQVIISAPLAVATTQLSAAEDLVNKGVDAGKAQAVGAVQAAGLATGIWMPILGKTGFQRVVLGGAGFNVAQGAGTRAASGAILEGTPAAGDYKAFDSTALTLDVLLGAAFGGIAHLSPRQRAQGEAAWAKIEAWGKNVQPSDVDALATLRQAQHLNVDSSPVIPAGLPDIEAHTQRLRTAIDQLTQDMPVRVDDLPPAQGKVDAARMAEAERGFQAMQEEVGISDYAGSHRPVTVEGGAARLHDLTPAFGDDIYSKDAISFFGTGDTKLDRQTLKILNSIKGKPDTEISVYRAVPNDADSKLNSGDWVTVNKKYAAMHGEGTLNGEFKIIEQKVRVADLTTNADSFHEQGYYPERPTQNQVPDANRTETGQKPDSESGEINPLASEAQRFAAENPDFRMIVGKDADGADIALSPKEYLDNARADVAKANDAAKVFEIAASCMLGAR
jgi:hypothetical protein